MGSFTENGRHIDAQIIENQGRAAHGRNVKAVPAGRNAAEDQSVGSRKDGACQKTAADGQAVVPVGQMNAKIHRPEEIAHTVALQAIKTAGRIDHQYF